MSETAQPAPLEQNSRWIWFGQVAAAARSDTSAERPALVAIQAVVLVRACSADPDGRNVRQSRSTVARIAGVKRESVRRVDEWLVQSGLMAAVRTLPGNVIEYRLTNPVVPLGVKPDGPEGDNRPEPDPPVVPPVVPLVAPEGDTTSNHSTTNHAAAAAAAEQHLERHIAFKGSAVRSPRGYRRSQFPEMVAGLVAGDDLEARWPTRTPQATTAPVPAHLPGTGRLGRRLTEDASEHIGTTDRGAAVVDLDALHLERESV